MNTKHNKLFEWRTILFSVFILFGAASFMSKAYNRFHHWKVFASTANHFEVSFPNQAEEISDGDTVRYVGKDSLGNLYVVQRFVPDAEMIKGQSSKNMLRTTIKVLVMKDNVKLDNTTYTEYLGETVAVDFSGRFSSQVGSRFLKGKIILDRNSFYYLVSFLKIVDQKSLANYDQFIKSFRLVD